MAGVMTSDAGTGKAVAASGAVPHRTSWWRRLLPRWSAAPVADPDRLLGVLEAAREQLAAGWVQYGWWVMRRGSRQVLADGLGAPHQDPGPVDGACLVGALVLAGRRYPAARDEIGAAVDVVHDVVWPRAGQPENAPLAPATPWERLARVRELTRWNDRPERTQQEVLAVLDRAIAATIMRVVTQPGPDAVAPEGRERELAARQS